MCSILNLDIVPCVYLLSKAYEKLTSTPDAIQFSNFRSDDFYIKYHTFINYLYHIIHKYAEYCPEILDSVDLRNSKDIIKILSIAKFKSLGLEIEHTADSIAIDWWIKYFQDKELELLEKPHNIKDINEYAAEIFDEAHRLGYQLDQLEHIRLYGRYTSQSHSGRNEYRHPKSQCKTIFNIIHEAVLENPNVKNELDLYAITQNNHPQKIIML